MRKQVSQEVLDLLKLDRKTFDEKLVKGETLAQIAQDQGVSRDDLKQTMTTSFNQELDKQKARFADNLDKLVDSKQQPHEFGNKGFRHKQDLSETAKLLGISNDDLKQALASGKSLADLATEKGIDVKQLIDLQVNNLMKRTNQDLKDGKITQEQADKHKAQFTNMATKMVNSKGFQGKSGDKFMIRKHKDGSETQPQSQLQPESQTQTQQ